MDTALSEQGRFAALYVWINARHGRGKAWARHAMCESALIRILCVYVSLAREWLNIAETCGCVRILTYILFIQSAVCRTTGPQPLPMRVLHSLRSSASSSNFQFPLVSLRSSSSCLCLLPRLPVTSILSCLLPPATCFRRHFLPPDMTNLVSFPYFILDVG